VGVELISEDGAAGKSDRGIERSHAIMLKVPVIAAAATSKTTRACTIHFARTVGLQLAASWQIAGQCMTRRQAAVCRLVGESAGRSELESRLITSSSLEARKA
jgi:hypothetical protein